MHFDLSFPIKLKNQPKNLVMLMMLTTIIHSMRINAICAENNCQTKMSCGITWYVPMVVTDMVEITAKMR